MEFRIADTFTDALARLPAQEQKAVKNSAFDLQMNPVSTGLQLHRIDKSKDKNFWSVRVNSDLRIIVHKTASSILLAYVDHHDKAYNWAERRRIEAHPKTGAIQIVEVRERVEQIAPKSLSVPFDRAAAETDDIKWPFKHLTEIQLLSVGVPPDWLAEVLDASEDSFLALASHLPAEAADALLECATTGSLTARPAPFLPAGSMSESRTPTGADKAVPHEIAMRAVEDIGYAHPDAQRRFRTIENADELRRALEYPWDKWLIFLHPSQRNIIERDFAGPARVAGSAGTGKTVVALHRAVRLARSNPIARILLTTFSQPLANMLERKLAVLAGDDRSMLARITVTPFHGIAAQLYELAVGRRPHIASDEIVGKLLAKAAVEHGAPDIPQRFLLSEWLNVVDAWQIASEEAYGTVPRLGRKNRLGAKQRARLWPIFHAVRLGLSNMGTMTWAQVFTELSTRYPEKSIPKPFTNIVVDESQDLGVAELRLLSAIAPTDPNGLFFAGDLGQRIFQQPFSWLGLGVDVRGRSEVLKVNYRTSHQIRQSADRLLPSMMRDVDGIEDHRAGTVSAFNGPEPKVQRFETSSEEVRAVGAWIQQALSDGLIPSEIGVFVRSHDQLDRARSAVKSAGAAPYILSESGSESPGQISVGTMHLAKGLEYKAVAVMACDDEVVPLQARVEAVADEIELDDVYETERQLLYVACTRARDRLFVSGVLPGSEFLADLNLQ